MASTSKSRSQVAASIHKIEEAAAPLIPHIKINDSMLPKYAAALLRPSDSVLPADELDYIQLELEQLLSTVALRYRVLKSEIEALDRADERKEKKGRLLEKPPNSPNKKKKLEERGKMGSGKMFGAHSSKISRFKNQSDDSMDALSGPHLARPSSQDTSAKYSYPRNDVPNKFWLSVEPYCMPITQEDVKLLDDLLEEFQGGDLPPIPDLGPHYSTRWELEEIKSETDDKKGILNGDVAAYLKKGERGLGDGVTGPLTQRLISGLIEEHHVNPNAENMNSGSENVDNSRSIVSLMKNGIGIEQRLKKELFEQGIFDDEDLAKEETDEILNEIKKVRAELMAIGEYNANELRKLHKAALEEMKRLEVKKRLDGVDQEIIELHKRVQAARLKRRPLTSHEREEIIRLTEEQKLLADELETYAPPGPHFAID